MQSKYLEEKQGRKLLPVLSAGPPDWHNHNNGF